MDIKKLKNKDGEILTTKDGSKELVELKFQVGDQFVPLFNSIIERSHEAVIKDKKQTITNYSLKCRVRGKDKKEFTYEGEVEVFATLTPTQAERLKQKIEEGLEINQNLWVAYAYESKKYGPQIGLGLKKATKPAKSFEQLDKEMADSIKEDEPTSEAKSKPSTSADNKAGNKSTDDSEPIKIEEI